MGMSLDDARKATMAPSVIQHPMHAMVAPIGPAPPPVQMAMDRTQPDMPSDQSSVGRMTPVEQYENDLGSRLMSDYGKDANPYGSPTNHPGKLGKFLHGLSVATGGPNRRFAEEQKFGNTLEGIQKEKAGENLQDAEAGAIPSEESLRGAQTREANDRANALENTASEDEAWKPLFGGNGQVLTAGNGQIVESDKGGNLRLQALPGGATVAPKETPDHSAFAEYEKNPQSYEAFEKLMHSFGQAGSHGAGFSPYAAILALRTAYQDNPGIIPVAAKMAVQAFGNAGIRLSPEQVTALSGIPQDQPLSPETGQPIGTTYPGAPTAAMRTSAQGAATLESMINENILPALNEAVKAGDVGPMSGRVQDFMLRRIGNPDSPAAKLQATLDAVPPMLGRMYGFHSAQYAHAYQGFLNTRMTPEAMRGYLQGVTAHARTTQQLERGYGETNTTNASSGPPTGAVGIGTGSDGKKYYVDAHNKPLGVAP